MGGLSPELVMVITLISVLAGYSIAMIMAIKKQGDITGEGWEKIRVIIYSAIDDGIALGQASQKGEAEIIDETVRIIHYRIQGSNIPEEDKTFWTEDRIDRFITPVIHGIMEKLATA